MELLEDFDGFGAEAGDGGVVEPGGNAAVFVVFLAFDFRVLASEVAIVTGFGDDEIEGVVVDGVAIAVEVGNNFLRGRVGAAGDFAEGFSFDIDGVERFSEGFDVLLSLLEDGPAIIIDDAPIAAKGSEAEVGVVGAEVEAVFGPAGEHAVGFGGDAGDEIIEHDTDVGLIAAEANGLLVSGVAGGIQPGDESLPGGFFVAAGAVDLTGEEEAGDGLGHAGGVDLMGANHVVFDGVTMLDNFCMGTAGHETDELLLDFEREGSGDAVGVDFVGEEGFWFEEDMVGIALSEADDFVFDGGAIAGAAVCLDLAGEHGGAMEVGTDDVVATGCGVGDATLSGGLGGEGFRGEYFGREEGKCFGWVITGLGIEAIPIEGFLGEAGGGAGFEATEFEAEALQGGADSGGGSFTDATARGLGVSGVHEGAHEGAGGEDDALAGDRDGSRAGVFGRGVGGIDGPGPGVTAKISFDDSGVGVHHAGVR